jgi:hypothetical protein
VDPLAEAHRGKGTRTYVEELFAFASSSTRPPVRLSDLYAQAVDRGIGGLDGPA